MAVLRPRRTDEIDPFSDLLFNTLLATAVNSPAEEASAAERREWLQLAALALKAAGEEEIARVEGINAALAARIYATLRGLAPPAANG